MKKGAIDLERAVVAYYQAPEIAEPADRAFDHPAFSVSAQRSAILRGRTNAIFLVRTDQFDPPTAQTSAQRIAVVRSVGNHPFRLLARTPRVMPSAYVDRRECRLREFDLCRGCRTKVVSQRNTLAVDHHHPLRPLAPLGFSDSAAPFFAEAKLPSKKDSLQSSCPRSLNSLKNVRQMFNQTPCSSQSRSRRQQVEGCGYFSGKSCQRAPLRRIHRIPSSTWRFSIHGRPPLRCLGGLGSKGAIFFHCASVSNEPDRAIGPPVALLTSLISHFGKLNHRHFRGLYRVMQQLLVTQGALRISCQMLKMRSFTICSSSHRRHWFVTFGAAKPIISSPRFWVSLSTISLSALARSMWIKHSSIFGMESSPGSQVYAQQPRPD